VLFGLLSSVEFSVDGRWKRKSHCECGDRCAWVNCAVVYPRGPETWQRWSRHSRQWWLHLSPWALADVDQKSWQVVLHYLSIAAALKTTSSKFSSLRYYVLLFQMQSRFIVSLLECFFFVKFKQCFCYWPLKQNVTSLCKFALLHWLTLKFMLSACKCTVVFSTFYVLRRLWFHVQCLFVYIVLLLVLPENNLVSWVQGCH